MEIVFSIGVNWKGTYKQASSNMNCKVSNLGQRIMEFFKIIEDKHAVVIVLSIV